MAMMISRFHKLIQSRLLWVGFLVVIVFSFVIWGMVWPSDLDEQERLNAAGLLDGEPVSHSEFRSAYLSTFLGRALAMGRDFLSTPENEAILRRMTWQRLATLREAAKLGITATEDDLVGAIRANFTDEQGRYHPQQYRVFIHNMIQPMGFTAAHFEQHVREEIIMQKLGSLIGRQAHVTPLEIRQTFNTLLDTFTVEYAQVLQRDIADDVEVTEAEARAFFDENPNAFQLPERRQVLVVSFPIANYLDDEVEFTDDEIQDYYELNIADFVRMEALEDGEMREEIVDLDEAREDIIAALRRDAALVRADSAATELAFRTIPGRDGTIPDFAAEAEKAGVPARELPPFSRFEVPLEDAGLALTMTAFELDTGAFDRVSIPVAGQDEVHVIYLQAIHPPRTPEFEDVSGQAVDAARRQAVANALSARATAIREAAQAGLAAGQSFAQALEGLDADVVAPAPFTGLSGSASDDDAIQALVHTIVTYNPGEVTDPIPTGNGVMVAWLAHREPADPASFGAYRDEIASAIRNRRGQGRFMDWQDALLAPDRFTDLQRQAFPEDWDDLDEYDFEDEEAEAARWEASAQPQ